MTRPVDLIKSAISVEGCLNPVAYNNNYELPHGYWICKVCTSSFFGGAKPLHDKNCLIKDKTPPIFIYQSPQMIYVTGNKDDGAIAPFTPEKFEKIKDLAKKSFYEKNVSPV